ncbi:serine hydrolase [Pseudonocardia acaciae]|uniref:serine hydrolase n=1 Tax=Pseudonocardia acaciae TaxID=551276 RepID=UPI0006868926|nr:serine hydrolase [Pseudonocardia acaciae]
MTGLDELAARATKLGGALGAVIEDLRTGRRAEVGAQRAFTSASVIKLPIAMTVLAGELPLDRQVMVRAAARAGGSGILRDLEVPALSVRDLLTLMITISDNTATNVLIDLVGIDAVNAWCAGHGLTGTVLARRMFDAEARARGEENLTTARDVATLLADLARGRLLDPPATDFALDVLARQRVNDRLPRHLPDGLRLAHKTGELDGIRHDAGIVLDKGKPTIVVVALTEAINSAATACDLIAEVGRLAY